MVEKHALDRLNKVEEDRQSVYKKKNNGLNFNKICKSFFRNYNIKIFTFYN